MLSSSCHFGELEGERLQEIARVEKAKRKKFQKKRGGGGQRQVGAKNNLAP